MIFERPKFIDSPYFVDEVFNWHLKDGAPKEVQDEFNAFMKQVNSQYTDEETDKQKRKK
jgi:hypothetical protein